MGLVYSIAREYLASRTKFVVTDVPDLDGKVAIITGGNTGIGKETVRVLLSKNAKVYILARNKEKAMLAISELKEHTGHEAYFIPCDLSDLVSVRKAAQEFTRKENELHILINNAAVMTPPIEQLTAQGYDLQLGTNALAHFYLTTLLLPTLLFTAKSNGKKVRVVNVSSVAHCLGTLDFATFRNTMPRRRLTTMALYGQSKFANIVFTQELVRRYGEKGIISVAVHPGQIRTQLWHNMHPLIQWIVYIFLFPPSTGALTQLYAATSPEIEDVRLNGMYFVPWARLSKPDYRTQNPELGRKFWNWCEDQVKDIN